MKIKLSVTLVVLVGALTVSAQSNNVPPIIPPGSGGAPALDTNALSFSDANISLELYTGVGFATAGASETQSKTGLYYDLSNGFGPAVEMANEVGTANVMAEMDAFFEYHKRTGSLELIGGIGGGYNWDTKNYRCLIAAGFNYNLTKIGSTYAYVGTRTEFSFGIQNKGDTRPGVTPMLVVGDAF